MNGIEAVLATIVLIGGGCLFILAIAALDVAIAVCFLGLRLLIRAELRVAQALSRFAAWILGGSARRRALREARRR